MAADVLTLVSDGAAIERKHHKDVAELVGVTKRRLLIGGFRRTCRIPTLHTDQRCWPLNGPGRTICSLLLGYADWTSVQPAQH